MKINRFGFNMLVAVYLLPLLLIDLIGNTGNTGAASDFYYYKTMFDGLLMFYAIYAMFTDKGTADPHHAAALRASDASTVADFSSLGAFEYIYVGFLCVYSAFNWWTLHQLNSTATGIESLATLVWSFVSLAVVLLSATQFYRMKSGSIVQLIHKAQI